MATASTVETSAAIETTARLFCGFGDRTRLAILTLLAAGEQRVGDIVESVGGTQSNISGHLRCLKDCGLRSEEHTSELQSLMRISYAVFCLKKKRHNHDKTNQNNTQYKSTPHSSTIRTYKA